MAHHWELGAEQPSSDALKRVWTVKCTCGCGAERRLDVSSPHFASPSVMADLLARTVACLNEIEVRL